MSLQTTAENRQWLCRRDVMWQTVPDSRGGNRESSVAVRRQPRTANNQRRWRGRTQTMSSLDVCRPAEVVGEVRRRYTLQYYAVWFAIPISSDRLMNQFVWMKEQTQNSQKWNIRCQQRRKAEAALTGARIQEETTVISAAKKCSKYRQTLFYA